MNSPPAPLRVLFVDDEEHVLAAWRRMLHPRSREWDMRFESSGHAAISCLEQWTADAVVSDMRMPVMSGGELLAAIHKRWPATIRIILSGETDRALVHGTIGVAHLFLRKPCDEPSLRTAIERARLLRDAIPTDPLRRMVGAVDVLPCLPAAFERFSTCLNGPSPDLAELGAIASSDMAIAARVLQLVNSSFFGERQRTVEPAEAVARLGIEVLSALAGSTRAFVPIAAKQQVWFDPGTIWSHSLAVASIARRAASALGLDRNAAEEAATAGLMHDIGKLIIASRHPIEFAALCRRIRDEGDHQGERLVLGSTHGEIGGYLLGLWGLPDSVVEAVAWHHEPLRGQRPGPSPLTCVHIADALAHARDRHESYNPLCRSYLDQLGIAAHAHPGWLQEIAGEPAAGSPAAS